MTEPTELPTGIGADAPTVTAEATAAVAADALWTILSDINAPAPYSAEFDGADWVDGAVGPALGARFVGRNSRGERAWQTSCTVTTYEPGRRFGWTVEDLDDPVATWTYELERDGDTTTVRQVARLGPSMLSGLNKAIAKYPDRAEEFTLARLVSLQESMQAALDAYVAEALEETRHG